jgi:mannan endo-1,4-beta-mannosidase
MSSKTFTSAFNCVHPRFLCCFVALAIAHGVSCSAVADETMPFVTRRGDQLYVGDERLRFVSFNIPNLLVVEDAFEFTKPSPWRWPDEFEIEDALESVRQMGGQVVRTYVVSVRREGSDMGDTVHVLAPGEFNEEGFRALDKVLEVAGRKGIRIIIPLVDNWKWMGGVPQYAAFRGKPPEAFWSDPELIADFKRTIEYVLNRKNTYTGKLYRDDSAIFGWETGNEIDATADWTREIAATIKQHAPNHLVIDGRSLHGI